MLLSVPQRFGVERILENIILHVSSSVYIYIYIITHIYIYIYTHVHTHTDMYLHPDPEILSGRVETRHADDDT